MKSSNIERPFRMLKQPIFLCILFFASAGAVQADKIYTIGDSITRGTTYDFDSADYPLSAYRNGSGSPPNDIRSYREHLHDLLVEDPSCDATVEWVGTKDEPNRIPVYHEGRSGWRADEIINRTWAQDGTTTPKIGIDGWLGEFQPDHVLIHLGTNDMQQGQSAESTRDDINSLLDTVYAERPNATVFLANVIPIFGWWANHVNNDAYDPTADTSAFPGVGTVYPEADVAGEAQQLSSLIGSLVTTRSNNGDDIHLVDVNTICQQACVRIYPTVLEWNQTAFTLILLVINLLLINFLMQSQPIPHYAQATELIPLHLQCKSTPRLVLA